MIIIEDFILLLEQLPKLFWYVATGYVFIKIFNHVSYNNNQSDLSHVLLESTVGSFIIKTVFDFIGGNKIHNDILYSLLILVFTVLSSYIIALFCKSKLYDEIQTILHINRTASTNIWYDIFKKDMWVRVFLKDGVTTYLGQIEMLEENKQEPIIVLSRYQLVNLDGDVILDYSQNPKEKIMLNMKDFEQIELTEIEN